MTTNVLLRSSLALAGVLLASTALLASPSHTPAAAAAPTAATPSAITSESVSSAKAKALTAKEKKQKTIVDANFDDTERGKVDYTSFRHQVGPTIKARGAYAGMTYRKDYRGSGNVVRTKLSGGKFVASGGEGRGNILPFKLPGAYDAACMSYDVRFAAPFDFSAGGKLPGFVGVAPGTSPSTPEGGGSTKHGWSGRLMWLGPKVWKFVRDADRSNMVVTYLYHPGQVREFGDNVSWGATFTQGVWHTVRQCHVMNTVGKSDGVLRTWFDGQLVMENTHMVYRTDPMVHITHFDWSIFRGGSSSVWASPDDGYVDIDNLKITAS